MSAAAPIHETIETIHATAVLVGACGLVIRGPSGSGKSSLALRLIQAAGPSRFARLIADDRVAVEAAHGHLVLRPVAAGAGLIEIRGNGIAALPHEGVAVARLVVDLAVSGAPRLPEPADQIATIAGIALPRLAFPPGCDPMPQLWAALPGAETACGLAAGVHPGLNPTVV